MLLTAQLVSKFIWRNWLGDLGCKDTGDRHTTHSISLTLSTHAQQVLKQYLVREHTNSMDLRQNGVCVVKIWHEKSHSSQHLCQQAHAPVPSLR
jgi:hypothetical protein